MTTAKPATSVAAYQKYWLLAIGIVIYLATVALLIWRPANPWPHTPGIGDIFACFLGAALNPLLAFVLIVHLMLRPDPKVEEPNQTAAPANPTPAQSPPPG